MKVQCPHCGEMVAVHGLCRKRLNLPIKNVLEAIKAHRSVAGAARELRCSPAYIFGVLKANGKKLKDVLDERR